MGVNIFERIILGAAATVCIPSVAAFAAEELIVNAGFETGYLNPWHGENISILYGGHTGRYHAGYYKPGCVPVKVTIQQDLARKFSPAEVEKVSLWAYGGVFDSEGLEDAPADISVYLSQNRHDDFLWFSYFFWEFVEFPRSKIKEPFDYIRVVITVPSNEYDSTSVRAGVDDVSVLINPTGARATSLGRVKALYR